MSKARILKADQLHELEKKALMELGWDGKSGVPADFFNQLEEKDIIRGSNVEEVANKVVEENIYVSSSTPQSREMLDEPKSENNELDLRKMYIESLKKINESYGDIEEEKVNPVEQAAKNIFKKTQEELDETEQSANLTPAVAEVLKAINTNETKTKDPVKDVKEEPVKKGKYSFVTDKDRQAYAEACITNTPMYKSYDVLNGGLTITYRDLTPEDMDTLVTQDTIDRATNRTRLDIAQMQASISNYSVAARLVSIYSHRDKRHILSVPGAESISKYANKLMKDSPELSTNFKDFKITQDTPIRFWYLFVSNFLSPTLWNLVKNTHADFLSLVIALESLAKEKDFF